MCAPTAVVCRGKLYIITKGKQKEINEPVFEIFGFDHYEIVNNTRGE